MPPGQLKKWQRGQALPGDLRYNELPPDIYRRLAPLPAGHRYVTIAGDVLIIATATRMVIDAVEDLLLRPDSSGQHTTWRGAYCAFATISSNS
jgi:hypothetical protein